MNFLKLYYQSFRYIPKLQKYRKIPSQIYGLESRENAQKAAVTFYAKEAV